MELRQDRAGGEAVSDRQLSRVVEGPGALATDTVDGRREIAWHTVVLDRRLPDKVRTQDGDRIIDTAHSPIHVAATSSGLNQYGLPPP